MKKEPSFTAWLRAQKKRQDPVGDLSRDMRSDGEWPRVPGAGLPLYTQHLEECGACDGAFRALKRAYAEWSLLRREAGDADAA